MQVYGVDVSLTKGVYRGCASTSAVGSIQCGKGTTIGPVSVNIECCDTDLCNGGEVSHGSAASSLTMSFHTTAAVWAFSIAVFLLHCRVSFDP